MKPLAMALFSGALVVTAFAVSAQPRAAASTELSGGAREAAEVVDRFHAALARGDSVAAVSLLDPSATIFEEGSAEMSSAAYQASHLPADIAFLKTVREHVVRRTGAAADGLAWIATEGRLDGNTRGRAVDRVTTESMVLGKSSEGWRIVHIHWSSHAAPPAH